MSLQLGSRSWPFQTPLPAIICTFFYPLVDTFLIFIKKKQGFYRQILGFSENWVLFSKTFKLRRNDGKNIFLNCSKEGKSFPIFPKSRKKLKVHRSIKIYIIGGEWLNFFFSFLQSVFFYYHSLSGIKKTQKFFVIRYGKTNRSRTLTLKKRQKAQVILKILEVATHFSPKNTVHSSRSLLKTFNLYKDIPPKKNCFCSLR